MKFTFQQVKRPNDNDCWAVAISKAVDIPYKKIYSMFKEMTYEGGLYKESTIGYLRNKGFTHYIVDIPMYDALRSYNLKNGIVFRVVDKDGEGHVVYVKGNKIYDDVDADMMWWYIKEYKVTDTLIKLEKWE